MPSKQQMRRAIMARIRLAYADRHYGRLKAAVANSIRQNVTEISRRAAAGEKITITKADRARWARDLAGVIRKPMYMMMAHAWELAAQELGLPKGKSVKYAGKSDPPVAVGEVPEEFLTRADFSMIDKWVKTTAESASYTTSQRLEKIFKDAAGYVDPETGRGRTPVDIAKEILAAGEGMTEARAKMLAHTGAIWAYNEGAEERYADAGVPVCEWLTSDDDLKCPFCADMNGKRVATGDPFFQAGDVFTIEAGSLKIPGGVTGFDVRHPPLHPNCRCTLIPLVDEAQLD
jgi:hypothetical protein